MVHMNKSIMMMVIHKQKNAFWQDWLSNRSQLNCNSGNRYELKVTFKHFFQSCRPLYRIFYKFYFCKLLNWEICVARTPTAVGQNITDCWRKKSLDDGTKIWGRAWNLGYFDWSEYTRHLAHFAAELS
ncbi:hypothetical protein GDO86_007154 [Hymenochirus boettgeri]|uniref:Uncharacterized protein n=1 Tax=Hymenochirus boettgeri TaxID=247094 RepID=A0A8T2J0N4_9PIPI|nr:hypothetical protein GDO86_007154 [Hymenochirus boettgeri]